MQLIYIITLIIAVISNSVLIFILARRSERGNAIIAFIILLILINTWAIPQIILNIFSLKDALFIAVDKISAFGYTFIPVAYFIFALSYTNRLCLLRKFESISFVYLLSIVFLYFAWNTSLIETRDFARVEPSSWGYIVPTGPLFSVFLLWFESVTIVSLVIIFRFFRSLRDVMKKKQARLLIIAMLIPLIFGTITNGILPAFKIYVFPAAVPLSSIMALLITYAIFRYELFELTPLTILTNIGNGVITVNKRGRIEQINKAARFMLGLKNTEFDGRSLFKIISLWTSSNHNRWKSDKSVLPRVLESGQTIESSDYYISSPSKRKFPVECNIAPILQGKKINGVTLLFRDITREKELERSRNEFIGIASHELKTPITSIKLFNQILAKKLKKNKDTKYNYIITSINNQLDKITLLINDLLNINKIEEGRFVLDKKKSDLDDLIAKTIADFQSTTESHKITKVGKCATPVYLDEERITEVLINLFTNAVKYSPHADKVTVKVSEEKEKIIVCVQDYGVGIPGKDLDHVFDRFYRGSISHKSKVTGFGLGLYICSEIIKRHQGKIWVKSSLGRGSMFCFSLPVRTIQSAPDKPGKYSVLRKYLKKAGR